jgi:hypothetical protein
LDNLLTFSLISFLTSGCAGNASHKVMTAYEADDQSLKCTDIDTVAIKAQDVLDDVNKDKSDISGKDVTDGFLWFPFNLITKIQNYNSAIEAADGRIQRLTKLKQYMQSNIINITLHKLWISTSIMCLVLFSGCAHIKDTVRDASNTLADVSAYTELNNNVTVKLLYEAEDQIFDSCESLFTTIFKLIEGENIPLVNWLMVVLNSNDCRRAVTNTRQVLDAINFLNENIAVVK